MIDFINKLFGMEDKPKQTQSDFRSIKVHNKTYALIKDYAQRHNRSMATVVYIAMNHLLLLEKNYAKDINESN